MVDNLEIEKGLAINYQKISAKVWKCEKLKTYNNGKLSIEEEDILKKNIIDKQDLEIKLTNLTVTPFTNEKIIVLIKLLDSILDAFNSVQIGNNLTNEQGLMFERGIYNYVIWDIERTLKSPIFGWSVSNYKSSEKSVFNKNELQECIEDLKESLCKNRPQNYIELDNLISKSLEKISNL